jgi:hypothetical protein
MVEISDRKLDNILDEPVSILHVSTDSRDLLSFHAMHATLHLEPAYACIDLPKPDEELSASLDPS